MSGERTTEFMSERNRGYLDSIQSWSKAGLSIAVVFLLLLGNIPDSYATENNLCNCVAFRLDDIQDYFVNDVQIKIIDTFRSKNATLTIGIIGNYFGEDTKIISVIKERMSTNDGVLEIANHGWNHEDFTPIDKAEQSQLMANTNQKIQDVLGVKPSVFIPPFNKLDVNTIEAASENGISYISGNAENYPFSLNSTRIGYENSSSNVAPFVYHFPSTATTGDLNADDTQWLGVSHDKTLQDIDDSIRKYGYAIVTLHPQEYAVREGLNFVNKVDEQQIVELEMVLAEVHKKDIRIVSISEISSYSVVPEFAALPLFTLLITAVIGVVLYSKKFGALTRTR